MSTTATPLDLPPARPPARTPLGDVIFSGLCQAAGGCVLAIAASLLFVLVYQAWPFLTRPDSLTILTSDDWNPARGKFGALVYIYGTIVTSLIAMAIAVPLGVGAAAYLSEIAYGRIRRVSAFLLELLAAIPSVVYGFWAIEFLARRGTRPLFEFFGLENHAAGQGIFAAGLVLAVMILPYITAVSYDVCQAVPRSQREGALAIGATRWQTIWGVVLPYARPGIISACFLALGRAIGETMAVTMVIGNASSLPDTLGDLIAGTGDSIPSAIAKQLPETTAADKRAALITLGLILLLMTLITNLVARRIIAFVSRPRVRAGQDAPQAHTLEHEIVNVPPPPPAVMTRTRNRALLWNRFMTVVLTSCQIITVTPLFLILGYITMKGIGGVDLNLFIHLPNDRVARGLGHAMLGSVILVTLASLFAVPIGILAAILLSEYRTYRFVGPIRFVAELLGGVPSIVMGVFAYAVLVYPLWSDKAWGFSAWAGAFSLGVMMLPVVIRASEEAMQLVPRGLREASFALGATRRQTALGVVLPAALPAVITGVLLAVGRIAGETAPLLLTAQGSNFWMRGTRDLSGPTPSLPYYIYNYSTNPNQDDIRLAWAGAFVLIVVVLMLNVGTRLIAGTRQIAASRAD
ncbi:MAG: phosphate ABC transporter permease PstA [Bacteroidales bacterium]|nr:phosphate ABC transporter permease PstA [Bacteroidales bacterium]